MGAKGIYNLSEDNYQLSDSFSGIYLESNYKKTAFKDFLKDGENIVTRKQTELDAKLDELYNKNEEEGQIFEQHDHFYGIQVNDSLQDAILCATTIYLYSQFESILLEIADKTGELFNHNIKPEDFKCNKTGAKKYKKYIVFVSKISTKDLDKEWDTLMKFGRIRNCVVHNNGKVNIFYVDLIPYCEKIAGLSYDEYFNRITVSNEYLLEIRNTCFNFLDSTMEKIWTLRPKS